MELVVRYAVAAALVVAVSEAARRVSWLGALIAALPLVSVLGMAFLWHDTHDAARVARLASGIFWLVLPSLVLFVSLPVLLRRGVGFYPALLAASALTALSYFLMLAVLRRAGFVL
ncbi:MAG: DUF3147 family protein [Achromobacter sp.]|nr:DUF3147 family protein [Achromobacter sp.]